MARLTLESAPPACLPRRFLRASPAWGVVAGVLMLWHGHALLASRWAPSTLALVHVFVLGVLGSAVLGSLAQFLPVVAGIQPRWPDHCRRVLPGLYQCGVAGLIGGFLAWPWLLAPSAILLCLLIAVFVLGALAGARPDGRQARLRLGLAVSLSNLLATAVLGLLLSLVLAGSAALPLAVLTDLHAGLGLVGTLILLIGTVGSVVMPMFQGTAPVSDQTLAQWIAGLGVALLLAGGLRFVGRVDLALLAISLPGLVLGSYVLVAQVHAPRRRNPALGGFWRLGAVALVGAWVAVVWPSSGDAAAKHLAFGVLLIGIALPALVTGMLLEIWAFLAWLDLHRRYPRQRGLPSVDALLPERLKRVVLGLHVLAALALLLAVAWRSQATAVFAGAALVLAHGATLGALLRVEQGARHALPREPSLHAC